MRFGVDTFTFSGAENMVLRDRQHAAGSAARIGNRQDDPFLADAVFVSRQQEIHHEMNDIPRREMLTRVFVERLIKLPDELLEDRPHRGVVDLVGVQVDILEALKHLKQKPRVVEFPEGVVKVEFLENFSHVRAEVRDVVPEVRGKMRGVSEELLEVVARRVVESEARGFSELGVEILQLALQGSLLLEDFRLRRGEDTVEPS